MMAKKVLTQTLSQPLDGAAKAKFDIYAGSGNLAIDGLRGGEPVLASGELEYIENQVPPAWSVDTNGGQANLTLKADGYNRPWLRMPWQACNGATEWRIHLNPGVQSDVIARSGGGNVKLDFGGTAVTRVLAETGGGNMDVVLPDRAENLSVVAKSGAGNVSVLLPNGFAARIHATTGMGKVIMDTRFSKIDKNTYQSPDYDTAAKKAEITLSSGAGNVSVNTK